MKQSTWMLMLVLAALSLPACNTMHGLGKDIQKGGQAIERAAS
ncbi:MAG TPA: entericidin A/B family lipoprotein [Accumulibacter sp.]|mgnify:FL=1|jgi:entericidin B|nr:entericidin A/B family lipoprotein [Accumulibacter sp.]